MSKVEVYEIMKTALCELMGSGKVDSLPLYHAPVVGDYLIVCSCVMFGRMFNDTCVVEVLPTFERAAASLMGWEDGIHAMEFEHDPVCVVSEFEVWHVVDDAPQTVVLPYRRFEVDYGSALSCKVRNVVTGQEWHWGELKPCTTADWDSFCSAYVGIWANDLNMARLRELTTVRLGFDCRFLPLTSWELDCALMACDTMGVFPF